MCVLVAVSLSVSVSVCVSVAVAVGVGVCGGGGGVLLLVFRGKILGYVRRRTITEPFTKDVVIDHERWLGELKTSTVACVGNMRHRTNTPHVLSWTFGRTVCGRDSQYLSRKGGV